MKKNRISKNWINKQKRDIYVRQSQVDGYRARSAYKLIEIDEKFKIFKNGISVIDLGASPGSWSQYISRTVKSGRLVSIDLKGMEEIENTIQIKGDFTDLDSQEKIKGFFKSIDISLPLFTVLAIYCDQLPGDAPKSITDIPFLNMLNFSSISISL